MPLKQAIKQHSNQKQKSEQLSRIKKNETAEKKKKKLVGKNNQGSKTTQKSQIKTSTK